MFNHQTHLPQILSTNAYCSQEQHKREVETLFEPAWHCVGSLHELPRDGDFITRDLLGYPLIIWNREGQIQAFLNVCAHRHSKLTDSPCGHAEKLKCVYHGWEYDHNGDTCRIPDARSFRPLAKGELGLKMFRTEVCGQFIFVALSDQAPELIDFLGPSYELCSSFGTDWKISYQFEQTVECNWKLMIENVIETYHLDFVHPQTFYQCPPESLTEHVFFDQGTLFREIPGANSTKLQWLDRVVNRLLNFQPVSAFRNYHIFPHLSLSYMRLHGWIGMTVPLTPTSSKTTWYFITYVPKNNWRLRAVGWYLCRWAKRFFAKVLLEDQRVLIGVQKGYSSPKQSHQGLISTREERIFQFQRYVQAKIPTSPVVESCPS